MNEIDEVLAAWRPYVENIPDWTKLIEDIAPKATDCGPVYDLPNPIDRPKESFAIADMRGDLITGPHYHENGETEIYIVIQGLGLTIMGLKGYRLKYGEVVVTPPNTTHFTIPEKDLVLAVINTPPFNPNNSVPISETNLTLGFDKSQYERLSKR